jgi:hypothetical protein
MGSPTHYLKLAYLAETALVFNLTYTELRWKKEFNALTEKMTKLSSLSLTSVNRGNFDSVCNNKKCNNCDDPTHLSEKYEKFTVKHLSELVSIISSGPSQHNRKKLAQAWEYAECNLVAKYALTWFHYFVNRMVDRKLSFLSLIIVSIVLVFITLVDNNVDLAFNLLTHAKVWEAEENWSFWLMNILLITLVLPGIFWYLWKIFLKQYECLSFSLINAYQKISSGEISTSVGNLPP